MFIAKVLGGNRPEHVPVGELKTFARLSRDPVLIAYTTIDIIVEVPRVDAG